MKIKPGLISCVRVVTCRELRIVCYEIKRMSYAIFCFCLRTDLQQVFTYLKTVACRKWLWKNIQNTTFIDLIQIEFLCKKQKQKNKLLVSRKAY